MDRKEKVERLCCWLHDFLVFSFILRLHSFDMRAIETKHLDHTVNKTIQFIPNMYINDSTVKNVVITPTYSQGASIADLITFKLIRPRRQLLSFTPGRSCTQL